MIINTYHLLEGSAQARGLAVIIDVFRAFSLECYLTRNNAGRIIPVASKETAYSLRDKIPGSLLIGERRGVMLPGFDYGNSPAQTEGVDFCGRTVIHTTSAGTQGLEGAVNACAVIGGSLVNASAIARYILREGFGEVSLVCMGLDAVAPAQEDELCAEYIRGLIIGEKMNITDKIEDLKRTSGKKFFDPAQSEVFPARDFALCTALDIFDFVLRLERGKDGINQMVRIDA